jgi:putative transposase
LELGSSSADRRDSGATANIDQFYLTRQKLTGAAVFRHVRQECRESGVTLPSINAVRHGLRRGRPPRLFALAKEPRQRGSAFALFRESLKKAWPLDVLQIDHTPVDLILVDEAARQPIGYRGRPWRWTSTRASWPGS